ncbi:MAG TPA: hypothetical protein VMS65_15540, partial [Polyangiaceae bacterium]|nr:hypothetical protein [Polyangiaceae bacterium]
SNTGSKNAIAPQYTADGNAKSSQPALAAGCWNRLEGLARADHVPPSRPDHEKPGDAGRGLPSGPD